MIGIATPSKPVCQICGYAESHWLGDHLRDVHSMDVDSYLDHYPESGTASQELELAHRSTFSKERQRASVKGITTTFAHIDFIVNTDVPKEVCLAMPDHYRIPTKGLLARDVQDMAIALKMGRSTWVHGPPGTGKDAAFQAWCAMTRQPSLLFAVVQGADIQAWKYTRSFDQDGTHWEEGLLLRALRDGYITRGGRVVPYLIVLSDFDRATRQQAEELRLILDSIQGRISGPTGEVYPVLPGTIVVATANSSGGGDHTGRCISSQPIDASILDRFARKIQFHTMDPEDEEFLLRSKFPLLCKMAPSVIPPMVRATTAVREAIEANALYAEWSHRSICNWAGAAEDILSVMGRQLKRDLLVRSLRVVLDGLPNPEVRDAVSRLVDPHIDGGVL